MNRGYVKVWRKIEDSGLMQMPNTLALFMHILFNATHKDRKLGTPTGVIDLKRGQYVSGRIELAHKLKQSEREIRTGLSRLSELCIISIKTTNRYSLYTIENYNIYQDSDQHNDQQSTINRPSIDQQSTTKQECNNLNIKEKNIGKGSRLTKDWILPNDWIDEAKKINGLLTNERIIFIADSFKDYWISLSGAKGVKLDWLATWRNWIRNQKIEKPNLDEQAKQKVRDKLL